MSVTELKQRDKSCTQKAWALMCEKGQFTRRDIIDALDVAPIRIIQFTNRLETEGTIKVTKRNGEGTAVNHYQVVKQDAVLGTGRAFQPRSSTGTTCQQIWNTFRIHKVADSGLLLVTTSGKAKSNGCYVRMLYQAGYLRRLNRMGRRKKGESFKYRLIRNTGRLHPVRRPDGLWDQNTQTFYPFNKPSSNKGEAK